MAISIKYPDFLQSGTINSVSGNPNTASTITFGSTFSGLPRVIPIYFGTTVTNAGLSIRSISTVEATVYSNSSVNGTVQWIAIRTDI